MRERTIPAAIAIATVAVLLVGCGQAMVTVPSAKSASADTTTSVIGTVTLKGAPAPVPMGTPATSGTWTVTAKSTKRGETAGGMRATQGRELFVVAFELKSGAKKAEKVGSSWFVLADKGGTIYQPVPTADPAFLFNEDKLVKAGTTNEMLIAYAVPKGVGPFTWTFTPPGQDSLAPTPAVLDLR
jgi:hypothetical protein